MDGLHLHSKPSRFNDPAAERTVWQILSSSDESADTGCDLIEQSSQEPASFGTQEFIDADGRFQGSGWRIARRVGIGYSQIQPVWMVCHYPRKLMCPFDLWPLRCYIARGLFIDFLVSESLIVHWCTVAAGFPGFLIFLIGIGGNPISRQVGDDR